MPHKGEIDVILTHSASTKEVITLTRHFAFAAFAVVVFPVSRPRESKYATRGVSAKTY